MKKSILLIVACGFLTIYSCSDKKTTTVEDISDTTETVTTGEVSAPVTTEAITPMTDGTLPVENSPIPANIQGGATAKTAAGMNPAHGEPGHRCDISVGAPLNSAPNPAASPVTSSPVLPGPGQSPVTQKIEMPQPSPSSTPTITPSPAPSPASGATPTKTAPGMNPPHGEPGHDCAVSVGAPLKK